MAQCSFATELLGQLLPPIRRMGDRVDFQLAYVGIQTPDGWQSTHGAAEALASKLQLCANAEGTAPWLDFLLCQVDQEDLPPHNWKDCARSAGLDERELQECAVSEETNALFTARLQHSTDQGIDSSPILRIAGRKYEGGRSSILLARALCDAMGNAKHAYCEAIPKAIVVQATFLTDSRCTDPECDVTSMDHFVRNTFAGARVRRLDWSTPEAKKLYERLGLTHLPALLVGPEVKEDAWGWEHIKAAALPAQALGYLIPLGTRFQPLTAEATRVASPKDPNQTQAKTAAANL